MSCFKYHLYVIYLVVGLPVFYLTQSVFLEFGESTKIMLKKGIIQVNLVD